MKRRVCDSCFFYESAGMNNSGWCRHPDRQFGSGVRLVVRGNEIACRNGWDADLWVPKDIAPEDAMGAAESGSDFITSIIPARYDPPADDTPPPPPKVSEDIVMGHVPYTGYVQPEKDARDLVTNPRAAILRAREQFKTRQKREGRISDQTDRPALIVDATNDFPASDWDLPDDGPSEWADSPTENAPFLDKGAYEAPKPQINIVPPVTRDEIQRPYPTITSFAEDQERFESVPESSSMHRVPTSFPEPLAIETTENFEELDLSHDTDLVSDADFDSSERWADESVSSSGRREPVLDRYLRRRKERHIAAMQSAHTENQEEAQHYLPAGPVAPPSRRPAEAAEVWESTQLQPPYAPRIQSAVRRFVLQDRRTHTQLTPPRDSFEDDLALTDHQSSRGNQPVIRPDGSSGSQGWNGPHHAPTRQPRASSGFSGDELLSYAPASEHSNEGERILFYERDDFVLNEMARRPQDENASWQTNGHVATRRALSNPRHERETDSRRESGSYDPFGADDRLADGTAALRIDTDLPRWSDDAYPDHASEYPQTERSNTRLSLDAHTPRICRTCRDYRPSDMPDRGWCNNLWAFRHRRMVDADTLSCGSSALGSWWTANDSTWQNPADVSRHTQETPLLDRLLTARYEHLEGSRRASGGSGR